MIEGDNALKVIMKDLELLIFSSRELPLEHWSKFVTLFITIFMFGITYLKSNSAKCTPFQLICRIPAEILCMGCLPESA